MELFRIRVKGKSFQWMRQKGTAADFEGNKKSRHNLTPVVFDCVGLLNNGSSGYRPDYPLVSLPRLQNSAEGADCSRLRLRHSLG